MLGGLRFRHFSFRYLNSGLRSRLAMALPVTTESNGFVDLMFQKNEFICGSKQNYFARRIQF